jgi:hypothetical protein
VYLSIFTGAMRLHLWSQTHDRNLTDILKVQTDVASSIARQLQVTLGGDQTAKLKLGGTRNPEAYDAAAALQWLTKAERLRDPSFQNLRVDWALDPIRNEPQFKAIEARMNFPP